MKKLVFLFILISNTANSQSLIDYFSIEGLTLGSSFIDDVGSKWTETYKYCGEGTLGKYPVLNFFPRYYAKGLPYYHPYPVKPVSIYIEDEKVFLIEGTDAYQFETLVYDFALEKGDVVKEGIYTDFQVDSTYYISLPDGSNRLQVDLSKNESVKTSWVYGIGDIKRGFIPVFASLIGSNFVCARIEDEILLQNENLEFSCEESTCIIPYPIFDLTTKGNMIQPYLKTDCVEQLDYYWEFGDGNNSTEALPSHEYDQSGCYVVTLNLFSNCHPDTLSTKIAAGICINNAWEEKYSIDIREPTLVIVGEGVEIIHDDRILIRTTDNGQSWTEIPIPQLSLFGTERLVKQIKFYDDKKGIMICQNRFNNISASCSIFTSQDGGLTWNPIYESVEDLDRIDLGKNGLAWINLRNEILRSKDYGNTWESLDNSNSNTIHKFYYVDDFALYSFSNHGSSKIINKSLDLGETWISNNLDFHPKNLHFFKNDIVYARSNNNIHISTDGGKTWKVKELPFPVYAINFSTPDIGWIRSEANVIYYTEDFFQNIFISKCNGTNIFNTQIIDDTTAIAIVPLNNENTKWQKLKFDRNLIGECSSLGINNKSTTEIQFYPNPSFDLLTIENIKQEDFTIEIYDLKGVRIDTLKNQTQINVSGFPNGTYILNLKYTNSHSFQHGKFVVLR